MADIEIEKHHNLEFEQARVQAKKWLEDVKKQYILRTDYKEGDGQDIITFDRPGIRGNAIVDANKLRFEADLGAVAKNQKENIYDGLDKHLDKFFS